MPFNVSEEQSLLSSMLSERDAQISTLTHQLHSTSEILNSTQKELQSKSASRKAQREEHSATIKKLKEEHSEQRRILAKFEQNVKNGGGLRVHEYAALMRSANSSQVESSYVIRLQAQLCRAMHSLGVMESQLALVKENCSSLIKFMKEDLSHMVDDRTRREIELMNGLAKVDNEKRMMADEMDRKIQEKEELLDQVREEYEELGLEYDENEVKRALEVKYLLEQMEKVKDDKARLERELLGALLEREEQINKLRGENDELGTRLEGLRREAEQRDRDYGYGNGGNDLGGDGDGEDDDQGAEEEDEAGGDVVDAERDGEEDGGDDAGSDEEVEDDEEVDIMEEEEKEPIVSEVTSQLEKATIDEDVKVPDEGAEAGGEEGGVKGPDEEDGGDAAEIDELNQEESATAAETDPEKAVEGEVSNEPGEESSEDIKEGEIAKVEDDEQNAETDDKDDSEQVTDPCAASQLAEEATANEARGETGALEETVEGDDGEHGPEEADAGIKGDAVEAE